jgi:hypothetical protein
MILHRSVRCALSSSTVLKRHGPPIGSHAPAGECRIYRSAKAGWRRVAPEVARYGGASALDFDLAWAGPLSWKPRRAEAASVMATARSMIVRQYSPQNKVAVL